MPTWAVKQAMTLAVSGVRVHGQRSIAVEGETRETAAATRATTPASYATRRTDGGRTRLLPQGRPPKQGASVATWPPARRSRRRPRSRNP